ncbi:MAG: CoA transferase subunit A [Solirubrobacterales bacterium]|nr:CoA transferase subunit A [Solirubrobacterales bacterium]
MHVALAVGLLRVDDGYVRPERRHGGQRLPGERAGDRCRRGPRHQVGAHISPHHGHRQVGRAGRIAIGHPGVGGLHRFRDAIEHDWPRPVEIEEHSHAGMANRYAAGAAHLPMAVMRGYAGTDLMARSTVVPITCPFTGETLTAVPALRPDVAIVHAQEADHEGNVQLWGIPGVQKEAVLAAKRSLVTVERIVDKLELAPGGIVIPSWVITAVAEAPGGSRPSYSLGLTDRDNDFYKFWDKMSRDRQQFTEWMNENVLGKELSKR